jgi:flavin-binding protein dodecin
MRSDGGSASMASSRWGPLAVFQFDFCAVREALDHRDTDRLLAVHAEDAERMVVVKQSSAQDEDGRVKMAESVYKIIELVGTSTDSWERAAKAAVERASQSLRDLRVAEVLEQDLVITDGKVEAYRTKLKVSFKYEGGS